MIVLRPFATALLGALSVAVGTTTLGCASAVGSDPHDNQASDLRPLTADEATQLRLPHGFTVVGALPSVEANRSAGTGVTPQDDTQGGGGGNGPYYLFDYDYFGFSGRSGSYLDQIKFFGATETTGSYGGGGGNAFNEIACPVISSAQTYMVGITGRSGSYIDALGPICGTSTTQGIAWTTVGGTGGSAFNYRCPLNTWIIGWAVRSGSYVDQLTAFCGTSP